MDIEMLYFILDEEKSYQDFTRNEFLFRSERVINDFKSAGDTFLNAIEGRCNKCFKNKTGFLFVGNNSKNYMNLLFDVDNNKITDLFECTNFKTNFDSSNFSKRFWIHNFEDDLPF
jgi:hypothetical protein